nr:Uncharacterised protein [Salmonella sp. NCTC 7297]
MEKTIKGYRRPDGQRGYSQLRLNFTYQRLLQ